MCWHDLHFINLRLSLFLPRRIWSYISQNPLFLTPRSSHATFGGWKRRKGDSSETTVSGWAGKGTTEVRFKVVCWGTPEIHACQCCELRWSKTLSRAFRDQRSFCMSFGEQRPPPLVAVVWDHWWSSPNLVEIHKPKGLGATTIFLSESKDSQVHSMKKNQFWIFQKCCNLFCFWNLLKSKENVWCNEINKFRTVSFCLIYLFIYF